MRIEAVFGGILALFVIGVALYAIVTGANRPGPMTPGSGYETPTVPATASDIDRQICSCYSRGFDLAGSEVGVASAEFATEYKLCRSQFGERGGCAFTAGWDARISAKPFEASCRAYLRRKEHC